MSRTNAARRNRALRKIRASRYLPPEIKLTIEAILDLLSPKTGYNLAWPSAVTLAKRTGKSRRTVLWHVKVVKQLGIFRCHQLTPQEAKDYALSTYGLMIKLDRCSAQAPNLFEVNPAHPLWSKGRTIPEEIDRNWGEIVRRIKAQRNARTTSRLSSDPVRRPSRRTADDESRRRYCLAEIRQRLSESLARASCSPLEDGFPSGADGAAKECPMVSRTTPCMMSRRGFS
jgi:hypothetical protein